MSDAPGISARAVVTEPQGELTGRTAHLQLGELDARQSSFFSIDEMQVRIFPIREDFFNIGIGDQLIAQYGWNVSEGNGGLIDLTSPDLWGVVSLSTGPSAANGREAISLGVTSQALQASPVFIAEWRSRLGQLVSAGTQESTVWLGLHDANSGAEATDGFYFMYSAADAQWQCKSADGGSRTNVDSGVTADTSYHRFRIVSDGAGTVRYYIDHVTGVADEVATISTNIPDVGDTYTPMASIVKSVGTTAHLLHNDYFALDLEIPGGR